MRATVVREDSDVNKLLIFNNHILLEAAGIRTRPPTAWDGIVPIRDGEFHNVEVL